MDIDEEEFYAMRKVCEMASDYKLGQWNDEFSEQNGGASELMDCLMKAVIEWEKILDEQDG